MGKSLNKKQRRFIRENCKSLSVEQMAQMLNIDPKEVQEFIKNLNLETPRANKNGFFEKTGSFLDKYAFAILMLIATSYILFFCYVCALRYKAFNYSDFDLAIYAQVAWNILHGSIQSSILGIPFLGNHLDLLMFLIAPIYALFRTPLTLLFLQTLFLGLGIIPLFLLAKDVLDKRFALLFGLLYFLYPALSFVVQYEFHPVAFSIFFLTCMFYYFEKSRFVPFSCFLVLSCLSKENIPLGIFFFGLYTLFFRKRSLKWSIVPILVAVLWLAIGMKILNSLDQGTINFSYIYSNIGKSFPDVVVNIFIHPGVTLKNIFTQDNMKFLLQLFLPLGFICLLSPKVLFISLPFLLQQLLSIRAEDHTIEYHYVAKLIPIMFIATIYGVKFALKSKFISRHKLILASFLLISSIVSNIYFGLLPKIPEHFSSRYTMKDISYFKQEFVDKIPKDASAVTTFEFLPKLSQRKDLYSFHHVYIGKHTLSSKEYILPEYVEYALIDFDDYLTFTNFHLPEHYQKLQEFFVDNKWGLVAAADSVGLFKKGEKTDFYLYQILKEPNPLSPVRFNIEDNIVGLGYNIQNKNVTAGSLVHLNFVWQCVRQTEKDYWIGFKLEDKDGNLLHQYNHPICYRIYPTFGWKSGDIISENVWLIVPRKLKVKEVWVKMLVIDRGTAGIKGGIAKGVTVKANMYGIFDSKGWINLGSIKIE